MFKRLSQENTFKYQKYFQYYINSYYNQGQENSSMDGTYLVECVGTDYCSHCGTFSHDVVGYFSIVISNDDITIYNGNPHALVSLGWGGGYSVTKTQ